MKLLRIVLLSLFSQVHCGTLAKLESRENETEMDQQRSVRVHRVADHEFLNNDDSRIRDRLRQMLQFGHEELAKLLTDFPNLSNLVQHEGQLYKELTTILKDLVLEGTVTLKSVDLAIREMKDASSTFVNPKNDNKLEDPQEELEELDTYHQEASVNESRENSRLSTSLIDSTNERESKTTNIVKTLDHVLLEIQNHLTFVRRMFDRLCRKHRSTLPTRTSYDHREIFALMNQPKKVSIL
ncbi:PREDICTED: uncharacterized protein LOC108551964 isoform X2 [Eufriesea mexicana]|uniref:uncharacterized protein LOC108551964 isoform X2 n=1 Tax=Eufriesea mexicana TaxID=516756 RepID=UPI00083BE843|nr:PREDICTED: uncharacterized protein LOC108551964 isoform X2 [Eufriesea mexicana]